MDDGIQATGGQTINKPCARCKQEVTFFVPEHEVVNSMSVSMLIFVHPEIQTCPNCGQPHQFVIGGFQGIKFGFQPCKPQNEPSIITVPTMPSGLKQ